MVPWLWGLNNLTKLPDFEIYICYRDFQCSYTTHTIWPLSTILLHCYMTTVHLIVVCRWYLVSRELQGYTHSVHCIAQGSNMTFSWCSRTSVCYPEIDVDAPSFRVRFFLLSSSSAKPSCSQESVSSSEPTSSSAAMRCRFPRTVIPAYKVSVS